MISGIRQAGFIALASYATIASAACTSNTTDTPGLQRLLQAGGEDYKLELCAGQIYELADTLNFTAANQEISTEGYPQDLSRATLLVTGFNKTTAVQATDANLGGVKLLNVQINGNRKSNADIYQGGGANIEFGGANQNQVVEYVRSYDPRGWSCLHIAEGTFNCANVTVRSNDIGPCGTDAFQNWADGISLSCADSLVENNDITDATDGGIVVFGAPKSTVRNNTISVKTRTMLGGINLVDVVPSLPEGNFSQTLVDGNTIRGGFATSMGNDTLGPNNASAIIKIGIAVGPDVWFSDGRYGTNQSYGASVVNNHFSGGFAFAMAVSSANSFVITNNSIHDNSTFIGTYGPNCTAGDKTPHPPTAFLLEPTSVTNLTLEVPSDSKYQFVNGTALGLTCFLPPPGNAWPYGDGFNAPPSSQTQPSDASGTANGQASSSSPATTTNAGSHGSLKYTPRLGPSALIAGLTILGIAGGAASLFE
ncbi:hypothetical protein IAU60_003475 [Kwoniella sp. DSM 27419]